MSFYVVEIKTNDFHHAQEKAKEFHGGIVVLDNNEFPSLYFVCRLVE